MALKKENLTTASMLDKMRCQFQQLQNDPRVREKVAHYLRWCETKVQPYQLWHVAAVFVAVLALLLYVLGVTKVVMMTSMILLVVVIVLPDLTAKTPLNSLVRRFPQRCREALEQQVPMVKGKVSNRMALGMVLVLMAFTAQSLFFTGSGSSVGLSSSATAAAAAVPLSSPTKTTMLPPVVTKEMAEKYYALGFQDAKDDKEQGFSLQDELAKIEKAAAAAAAAATEEQQRRQLQEGPRRQEDDYTTTSADGNGNFDYYPAPPSPATATTTSFLSRLVSFSSMGSMFYIYQMLKDKGIDQSTGLFSVGQLAANLQHHTEVWQQGMLLFSVYNLIRVLVPW